MDFSFDRAAEAKVLASAATLVLAVAVVSYRAWRARESSRMRNFVRGQSAGLPSPMPALPTWGFGALGGHTLAMQKGKVSRTLLWERVSSVYVGAKVMVFLVSRSFQWAGVPGGL